MELLHPGGTHAPRPATAVAGRQGTRTRSGEVIDDPYVQVTMSKTSDKSFPGQLAEAAGPQFTGEVNSPSSSPAFEPYVPPEVVADFLSVERRQVLEWARADRIPAHPLGHGKRRTWRFRLSEVNAAVVSWNRPDRPIIPSGSPPVARKRGDANG